VLAYLIDKGLNEYAQVAATVQAFIQDSATILTLIANDQLGESLGNLRKMESVFIDVDPEKEEMVPRPDPNDEMQEHVESILERAESELFENYRGEEASDIALALSEAAGTESTAEDVVVDAPGDAGGVDGDDAGGSDLPAGTEPDADGGDESTVRESDGEQSDDEGRPTPADGADSLAERPEEDDAEDPDESADDVFGGASAGDEDDEQDDDDDDGFGVFEEPDIDDEEERG